MAKKKSEKPTVETFAVQRKTVVKTSNAAATNNGNLFSTKRLPSDHAARQALGLPAFYSGTRFLAETLGGLPKRVNQTVTENGKTIRRRVEHYVTPLISQTPNALVNAHYLWETVFAHAVMFGNGYLWAERRLGQVVALHNLHALLVIPFRSGGRQWYALRNWNGFPVRNDDGSPLLIPSGDMIHIRNFSEDGEVGLSVLDLLSESLGLAKKLDDFLITYFEEGSAVNIVIEAERGAKPADLETLREGINNNNKGLDNAHNVMVLAGASAKNLTPALKDFAYDILKASSIDDIARILRVDPTMLYALGRATWGNLEQLGTALVTYSLGSWVRKAELECNAKLLTQDERAAGFYTKFSLEHLTRGNFAERVEAGATGVQNGLINADEWRESEGLDPRPGGDVYFVPANAVAVGVGGEPLDPELDLDDSDEPVATPGPSASMDPAAAVADKTPVEAAVTVSRAEAIRTTFGRFLDRAIDCVAVKQRMAFARARKNPEEWRRTFAAEQGDFLAEVLNPFVETVWSDPADRAFRCQEVSELYTAAVAQHGAEADPSEVVEALLKRIT